APSQRAQAMSDALFCALKDSNHAVADATVNTGVGKFGMQSRIQVPKYDASARQVVGQRLGKLYLFGVGFDIEDQDYVAKFPTEASNVGMFTHRTGYYMDLQTSTTQWELGGSGIVGPFTLSLAFGQDPFFRSMQNNAIAFQSLNNHNQPDPANVLN